MDNMIQIRHTDGTKSWYDESMNCLYTEYIDGRIVDRTNNDNTHLSEISKPVPLYLNPFYSAYAV